MLPMIISAGFDEISAIMSFDYIADCHADDIYCCFAETLFTASPALHASSSPRPHSASAKERVGRMAIRTR